jgi:hypothetical protein
MWHAHDGVRSFVRFSRITHHLGRGYACSALSISANQVYCDLSSGVREPLLPVVLGVMERLQVPSPHRPQILDSDRNQIA